MVFIYIDLDIGTSCRRFIEVAKAEDDKIIEREAATADDDKIMEREAATADDDKIMEREAAKADDDKIMEREAAKADDDKIMEREAAKADDDKIMEREAAKADADKIMEREPTWDVKPGICLQWRQGLLHKVDARMLQKLPINDSLLKDIRVIEPTQKLEMCVSEGR